MPTLDQARFQQVATLAKQMVAEKKLPAITFVTGTAKEIHGPVSCGSQSIDGKTPLVDKPIYLIASITKPVVAMAALHLVERGQLRLSDRVTDYLPAFGKQGKYSVEVRHLFTHTSGLPDMLPNNIELRKAQAPLSKFMSGICELPLAFPAGRSVQYQSTGLLVLSEIVRKITGRTMPETLRREIFQPLGMADSELGVPDAWHAASRAGELPKIARIPELHVPAEQESATEWNWNSSYWRALGAPWGGMLTTADDLAKFSQMMLRGGKTEDGKSIFSPATITAATTNQLETMSGVPEDEYRCRPWGLGWRLNWPGNSASFGDLLSRDAYGHWGATGTLMWIDPARGTFAILFSTEPHDISGADLVRLSNALAGAWV
jgi:CubicO group peptidase (beta-lactamase class C family)